MRAVCLKSIDAILEAGYTLPVASIAMEGKTELVQIICLHHVLLRNKAVLDQLKEGLSVLGVEDALKRYPSILEPFFVGGKQEPLTAGMSLHNNY